ncbi:MAG: hypothetical protein MUO64_13205 [Anaerolineales bacterium]|nr:hypothetical protein [Anaerolineales bacterium]
MDVIKSKLDGVLVIKPPTIFEDHRGTYVELYDEAIYVQAGVNVKIISIVADNDWLDCGFSAEVAARASEKCFGQLKSPVKRIGFAHTPCPTVRCLENEGYPNAVTIIRAVGQKLGLAPLDLSNEDFYSHERRFKGPF